jgi:hypothetical protein
LGIGKMPEDPPSASPVPAVTHRNLILTQIRI